MLLENITIKNFRSLRDISLDLAKINIIYGPASSGKSSILYAPLVIKNFVINPSVQRDSLFDLRFIHLMGFEECVFNRDKESTITIGFTYNQERGYTVQFAEDEVTVVLKINNEEFEVSSPYPMQLNRTVLIDEEDNVVWNGINAFQSGHLSGAAHNRQNAQDLIKEINSIAENIKKIDIIPIRRGFFKPIYNPINVGSLAYNEDEVASLIMKDQYLSDTISVYLEEIINYSFSLYSPSGASNAYLKVTDRKNKFPANLVNAGFGLSQLVYMLAKILLPQNKLILIEEPEIHLHPELIHKLAKAFVSIMNNEQKQFIIVTHSEVFISSLLSLVAQKVLEPQDLKIIFAKKDNKETIIEVQKVSDKGQVEGGLKTFIDVQLEQVKYLLNA